MKTRTTLLALMTTLKVHATLPEAAAEPGPRKVIVATVVGGYALLGASLALEQRVAMLAGYLAFAGEQAQRHYGRGPDLMVFPEYAIARLGPQPRDRAVKLEDVAPLLAALARQSGTHLVIPMLLAEGERLSNAAVLFDRQGAVLGIYRKVHPMDEPGSAGFENGVTPGDAFPVFPCDFGTLGVLICADMTYPDGWAALKAGGAEIVALPSASPQTARPAAYALLHRLYVVTATPRDNASILNPIGGIEAQVTTAGQSLVHQVDLSYRVLHWTAALQNGAAFTKAYGDRCGFRYDAREDCGLFWSNDPAKPIGAMVDELGLEPMDAQFNRLRALQDKLRSAPPP
ncbi:MAG: carbon-nitrogen hydrolase family protein [Lentisphaerae bacterium]|nr:carbon-nitrogen hydrolase family protein [Lentisphaerota bacterium]